MAHKCLNSQSRILDSSIIGLEISEALTEDDQIYEHPATISKNLISLSKYTEIKTATVDNSTTKCTMHENQIKS